MPLTRLISDLDHLITEFGVDGSANSKLVDELRLSVARTNELRRQLDIAQLKLDSVLSLAGIKDIGQQVEPGSTSTLSDKRFKIFGDMNTGIAGIDEAHREIYQAGNHLYWLAMQRDVNVQEVNEALVKLIQCTQADFTCEEKMMVNSAYAQLDHHRAIHRRMMDYLFEMQTHVSIEPLAVVVKLERFLGAWFLWHLQHDDVIFSQYYLQKGNDVPAPAETLPATVIHQEPAIAGNDKLARSPTRELEYLLRELFLSWLITRREKRHVARTSRAILSQYRSIAASHPALTPNEVYRFVVMAHTGCDTNTAGMILDRAEESFAEWPVSRALKLRDIAHYLTVTEYLNLYGKDFWMRSEINKMVARHIPKNI